MGIEAEDDLQQEAAEHLRERDRIQEAAYRAWAERLEAATGQLKERCRSLCAEHALSGLAFHSRVKEWDKLLPKLQDGRADPWDTCSDLIGIKIVVLSTDDVEATSAAVADLTRQDTLAEQRWYFSGPRAKGYQARHVQLEIPDDLEVPDNTRKRGGELQIVTAMQDAWGTFSHDDFYKSKDGVPFEMSKQVLRLAAVMNLVDQEIQSLRSRIGVEVKAAQKKARVARSVHPEADVLLDEVTLLAAGESVLRGKLIALRALGREAGFRVSGWPELIRLGFEADSFLQFAADAKITTLQQLRKHCEAALAEQERLEQLVHELESGDPPAALFDRPLAVLEAALMFDRLYSITSSPFKEEITAAIARVPRPGS